MQLSINFIIIYSFYNIDSMTFKSEVKTIIWKVFLEFEFKNHLKMILLVFLKKRLHYVYEVNFFIQICQIKIEIIKKFRFSEVFFYQQLPITVIVTRYLMTNSTKYELFFFRYWRKAFLFVSNFKSNIEQRYFWAVPWSLYLIFWVN